MINKRLFFTFFAFLTLLTFSSCTRSSQQVMADAKTAGRYTSRAMQSLFGKHERSQQITSEDQFGRPGQSGFYDDEFTEADYETMEPLDELSGSKGLAKNSQPGQPGSGIPSLENFQNPTGEAGQLLVPVYFNTDDHYVRGDAEFSKIKAAAAYLKRSPKLYVAIEGHCDERGTRAYNFSLGSRRSNTIRNMLVELGARPNQIFTISYGKERPVKQGHNESAWQHNRRGQFKVFTK